MARTSATPKVTTPTIRKVKTKLDAPEQAKVKTLRDKTDSASLLELENKAISDSQATLEAWNSGGTLPKIEERKPQKIHERKFSDSDSSHAARLNKYLSLPEGAHQALFFLENAYLSLNWPDAKNPCWSEANIKPLSAPPRDFLHVLRAIQICGDDKIPIPAWVTRAVSDASLAAKSAKNWDEVLGGFDRQRRDAYEISDRVGTCVQMCLKIGVKVDRAQELIDETVVPKLPTRLVNLAYRYSIAFGLPKHYWRESELNTPLSRKQKKDGQRKLLSKTDVNNEVDRVAKETKQREKCARAIISNVFMPKKK